MNDIITLYFLGEQMIYVKSNICFPYLIKMHNILLNLTI
ncbi:MAG: hypothetical protein BAJALOKI3v1_330014 [Promethearchaeota archaeon]|nr:MAG: hypothetical protein BAJALOKI3v1_330014 [Candidatus Lokiarchaeota archaeon]